MLCIARCLARSKHSARHVHVVTRHLASSGIRQKDRFKILFCGSDAFSVASLQAVLDARELWESIHVVTPRERKIGRAGAGRQSHKPLDKYRPTLRQFAEDYDLPTSVVPGTGLRGWTPPKPFDELSDSHLLLTASFGHIIPNPFLDLFPASNRLNVHPSLLPRYRGAAPIQWTIADGEEQTGVSVQRLVRRDQGIDAGHLLGAVDGIEVPKDATYWSLLPVLADAGAKLLVQVLRSMLDGTEPLWTSMDQGQTKVQLTGLTVARGPIPPSLSLQSPRPGIAFLDKHHDPKRLLVACAPDTASGGDGELQSSVKETEAGAPTWLDVSSLKTEGRKELQAGEWWNGLPKGIRQSGKISFDIPMPPVPAASASAEGDKPLR
ncbi:hypothetical protein JCM24511_07556 [Saitozyma sp. JCM 24511]|nr:hypothetical protein JCM24511_07556 [Saitozyma sp. JCM 24511]